MCIIKTGKLLWGKSYRAAIFCYIEIGNSQDIFVVAVMKASATVGHVPR